MQKLFSIFTAIAIFIAVILLCKLEIDMAAQKEKFDRQKQIADSCVYQTREYSKLSIKYYKELQACKQK